MYVIFWSIYLHFAVFVRGKNMLEKAIICLSRVDEKWSAGAFADNKKTEYAMSEKILSNFEEKKWHSKENERRGENAKMLPELSDGGLIRKWDIGERVYIVNVPLSNG
jgi:hypothetical protein